MLIVIQMINSIKEGSIRGDSIKGMGEDSEGKGSSIRGWGALGIKDMATKAMEIQGSIHTGAGKADLEGTKEGSKEAWPRASTKASTTTISTMSTKNLGKTL